MGAFLTVIGITLAVAAWELAGETAAEYVAKYIVVQRDMGISTREPGSIPPENAATARAVRAPAPPAPVVPVLLSAANAGPGHDPLASVAEPSRAAEETVTRTAPAATTPQPLDPAPTAEPTALDAANAGATDPLLSLIGDTPYRRPDGTVFMPIAAQRVLGLRTVVGERVAVPATVELPGRIVANPNTGRLVQSSQDGFVEAVAGTFPFPGQQVRRGELLAHLRPALTTLERAELDTRVQELTNDINLARKRMARLEEVLLLRYRSSRIEEIRVEIDGMRRELEILRAGGDRPIELRARTDGIVSRVDVASGQFVDAGHTLFDIVDPSRLWVSASAYEAGIRDRIIGASALTPEGLTLDLRFVGGGRTLRHQALPLHFDVITSSPDFTVDTPVTVMVQVDGPPVLGLRVPRDSVTRTSDGRQLVWERRSAESFVAHHVSPIPVDADSVLVTDAIDASARIVTAGVAALSQVQ